MKWIGKRISYNDDNTKTTFIVTPNEPTFVKALMGAWFFMWLGIGITIITAFATLKFTEQEQIITVIFLSFWLYYFVRVGRSFLWILYGKEYLKVDKIALTLKTSIKNYGKARIYYLENIKKINVSVPKDRSFQTAWENSPWIRGGERIEFEYLGKTIRFGRKLNEQDSKLFFQVLTKRIEDQLKKKKYEAKTPL